MGFCGKYYHKVIDKYGAEGNGTWKSNLRVTESPGQLICTTLYNIPALWWWHHDVGRCFRNIKLVGVDDEVGARGCIP